MSKNESNPDKPCNLYRYEALDELFASRIRLAVMALLAGCEEAEFTYLRDTIGASDGNLASHLRKLEDSGYVAYRKQFQGRKPSTLYRITDQGREALLVYSRRLAELLSSIPGGST